MSLASFDAFCAQQHADMRLCHADMMVESVMELTSTMAEHHLPAATAPLLQSCGSVCDTAAMNNCLDALGASLGMQSA